MTFKYVDNKNDIIWGQFCMSRPFSKSFDTINHNILYSVTSWQRFVTKLKRHIYKMNDTFSSANLYQHGAKYNCSHISNITISANYTVSRIYPKHLNYEDCKGTIWDKKDENVFQKLIGSVYFWISLLLLHNTISYLPVKYLEFIHNRTGFRLFSSHESGR